jgi:hypothetical protein
MYAAMRRRFYWRNMHKEVEETVRHCTVCAKNRVTERKRTSFLKLFPASGPLEFFAMDILGPLPQTEHGNRFLLVISDRFSKLTRTVPLRTITALGVAKAFCDSWVFSYGPPRYLLTENDTQFNAKVFQLFAENSESQRSLQLPTIRRLTVRSRDSTERSSTPSEATSNDGRMIGTNRRQLSPSGITVESTLP